MAREASNQNVQARRDSSDVLKRDSYVRTLVSQVFSDSAGSTKLRPTLRDSVLDFAKHFGRQSVSLGDILDQTYRPRASLYESFDATHISTLKKHYTLLIKYLRLQGIAELPDLTETFNTLPASIDTLEKWTALHDAFIQWLKTTISRKSYNQDILFRVDYILQQLADLHPGIEKVLLPLKADPAEYVPAGTILESLQKTIQIIEAAPNSPIPQVMTPKDNKEAIPFEIKRTIDNITQHATMLYEYLKKDVPTPLADIFQAVRVSPSSLTSEQIDVLYRITAQDAKEGIHGLWNGEDLLLSEYTALESFEVHVEIIMTEILQLKAFANKLAVAA